MGILREKSRFLLSELSHFFGFFSTLLFHEKRLLFKKIFIGVELIYNVSFRDSSFFFFFFLLHSMVLYILMQLNAAAVPSLSRV